MKVTVQTLEGHQFEIDGLDPGQQVIKLKGKVRGFTGVDPADQTLMYLGEVMEDDQLLSTYNVEDGQLNVPIFSFIVTNFVSRVHGKHGTSVCWRSCLRRFSIKVCEIK